MRELDDEELDDLYDNINKMMMDDPTGGLLNSNLMFWCGQSCCITKEPTEKLLALLTATLPMKDRCLERVRIREEIEVELRRRGENTEVLMNGL